MQVAASANNLECRSNPMGGQPAPNERQLREELRELIEACKNADASAKLASDIERRAMMPCA
jgi:hypothetical protein